MLSTPNILPSAWFNRSSVNPGVAAAGPGQAVAGPPSSIDPYGNYANASFDAPNSSSSPPLDHKSSIDPSQAQALPPAAFGLAAKPPAQSHALPSSNSNNSNHSGMFNASGPVSRSVFLFSLESTLYSLVPYR